MPSSFIVVPFYKHPRLARRIAKNFLELSSELRAIDCGVILVNDSPEDGELRIELESLAGSLKTEIPVHLLVNERNLGFVGSTNRGLEICRKERAHAILFNSDVFAAPGCIKEMLEVLEMDPMIGFVNPRSNNATICSLPMSRHSVDISYEEARPFIANLAQYLPRWQFIPTCIGFCMLIRNVILQDFGLLDEIYAPGYNEENDLCFRANRAGFRCAAANHAFAHHESSSSFSSEKKKQLDQRNRAILEKRYPEYPDAIAEYVNSPAVKFEELLLAVAQRPIGGFRAVVDLTHLDSIHNGTSEYALSIVRSLSQVLVPALDLTLMVRSLEGRFHRVQEMFPELRVIGPESQEVFDIAIKPAQPFFLKDLEHLAVRALHNFVIMLDVIAEDAYYIRPAYLSRLWSLTGQCCDGIIFISEFSRGQFNRRYPEGASTPQLTSLCSTAAADYARPAPEADGKEDFVFVVGNKFEHKCVKYAVERLHSVAEGNPIHVLGSHDIKLPNVKLFASGTLSDAEVDSLYREAAVVVFPSHYEGFGFPIPHALAKGATIVARDSSLNREIAARWNGAGTLYLFSDLNEMREIVQALLKGREAPIKPVPLATESTKSWVDVGQEIAEFVTTIARQNNFQRCHSRLAQLRGVRTDPILTGTTAELDSVRKDLIDQLNTMRHQLNVTHDTLEKTRALNSMVIKSFSFKLGRLLTIPIRIIKSFTQHGRGHTA